MDDRFWAKVDKTGDCWLWTGATAGAGYGHLSRRNNLGFLAHRVSWTAAYGEIPDGACVVQSCGNHRCVRPEHLALRKRTALSDGDVAEIRRRRAAGEKLAILATDFRVSTAYICMLTRGLSRRGSAAGFGKATPLESPA